MGIRFAFLSLFMSSVVFAATPFVPRNRPIDVQNYKIQIALDPGADPDTFDASVDIQLKRTSLDTPTITLDAEALQIKKVALVKPLKKDLTFAQSSPHQLIITLPPNFKGREVTLSIQYAGKIGDGHGTFFKVRDPNEPGRGPLFFTHFEPLGARTFFPCNDEPGDKATTEVWVQIPEKYEALSNGMRLLPKPVKRKGEKWKEVRWKQDLPHSTYLVSLAVGAFKSASTKEGGKEISVWVGPNKVAAADFNLTATARTYRYFEELLEVKYPWAKYATIGLPTYLWGGMENTSATHMNEERTILNDPKSAYEKKRIVGLAAHELAHQWFGDYATLQWWDDLWLNEAFASLLGTWGTQEYFQNEEAEIEGVLDTWDDYFRQEDGPRSHPIVNTNLTSPDDAFDAISYTKGEHVLRMLSHYVGKEKFRKGLKRYLTDFALKNATYKDFFAAVEKESGENLAAFRDSWLLQRGYPVVTYVGTWDAETSSYRLKVTQASNHADDKSTFHFKLPVVFHRRREPTYAKAATVLVQNEKANIDIRLPAEPEWVTVNAKSIVLARVRPEKADVVAMSRQAQWDPEALDRIAGVYALLGDFMKGEGLDSEAEEIVIDRLSSDPSPYVRLAILSSFVHAKQRFLPTKLGNKIFELAKANFTSPPAEFGSDPHGWTQWRSKLLGALGRVKNDDVFPWLSTVLLNKDLPLDDLGESSYAIAAQGNPKSGDVLNQAFTLHRPRGYRYGFHVQYAFGAYENTNAVTQLRALAQTAGADLFGRIGWAVRDNQTLKSSPQWSQFLTEFMLQDKRFGEEVKARLLQTIEESKEPHVKVLLQSISEQSNSERLKELSRQILKQNFGG